MELKLNLKFLIITVILGVVLVREACSDPNPDHSLAKELGPRGQKLDKQVEDVDRMIVSNWDTLIGPLSPADKAAFRRQYPDEAAEYDKITEHYGWPKKF